MIKKILLVMVVAMMGAFPVLAGDFGGTAAIDATVNVDNDAQNLSTDLTYVAGWCNAESFELYGVWNQDLNTLEFEEANIKFSLFDLNWAIGQKAVPIGFMHMQRPDQSVFITAPRGDFIAKGLHLDTGYDILSVEGMYLEGSEEYVVKTSVNLFEDGLEVFVSYNDVDSLKTTYGSFVVGGLFKYESLFANLSFMGEYMPDNGNFWAKGVTSPGIFDKVGLFAGYYNVRDNADIINGYSEFVYNPDAWVYGAYMDLSERVTASVEYKLDEGLNPIVMQFVATF